jgi:methionyl aminopeptidase
MSREYTISKKSVQEIMILRDAGKILAGIVNDLRSSLTSGATTKDIDAMAEALMKKAGVLPAFKGYRGYPCCVCLSINEEIVHGIPGHRVIKNGDIVSLDVGIIHRDFYSDTATTVGIGKLGEELRKLLRVTEEALAAGIGKARVDNHLSDISHAIQSHVEANGYSIVREFVGHGIGRNLHEDPEIPNFGPAGNGPVLEEGFVLAIEPMVNAGTWQTKIMEDGWTVVTADGKPSAHFEHCVAVTKTGPQILTQ